MSATKGLVIGLSGSGKSTSMRNFGEELALVNPVAKTPPFRKKLDSLDGVTDSAKIQEWIDEKVKEGKKVIVVDDFQYLLSVPYMHRIKEKGYDKWNDFGDNYFTLIEHCNELPDDVTVYFLSHCETLDDGTVTIKLIGKLLREKITIEGLFTIVLKTAVVEGKYYFLTQNDGHDTVKSPMGMFPSYSIDNDLKYVDDCVRNYYGLSGAKTDEEMAQESDKVSGDIENPVETRSSRRGRRAEAEETEDSLKEEPKRRSRRASESAQFVRQDGELVKQGPPPTETEDPVPPAETKVEKPVPEEVPWDSEEAKKVEEEVKEALPQPEEEPALRRRRRRAIQPNN